MSQSHLQKVSFQAESNKELPKATNRSAEEYPPQAIVMRKSKAECVLFSAPIQPLVFVKSDEDVIYFTHVEFKKF